MQPRKIYSETLDCGYRKCCPSVTLFDDGSLELSDNDPGIGSIGTVKLRPEVVQRLVEIIATK